MPEVYDDPPDDHDSAQAMIDWLSDKSPDVWFDVTQSLNWDNAEAVLEWIVSQPLCDRANAALVLWGCNPEYILRNRTDPRTPTSEGYSLFMKVLRNWKAGFYKRAELAWNESEHQQARYRTAVAERGGSDPLSIPADLLKPLPGRAPQIPRHLSQYHNAELRRLLWDLGTDVGYAPDSPEQRRIDRRLARDAILYVVRDILGFWGRSVPWLAGLAVVLIGGAFVLRWLVKGVVL